MGSLKRQAAKAERYRSLREEMRSRLRVVLASRIAQMDAEQSAVAAEIAAQTAQIDEHSTKIESLDAEHNAGRVRGYEFENGAKEEQTRAHVRRGSFQGFCLRPS